MTESKPVPPHPISPAIEEMHERLGLGKFSEGNRPAPPNKSAKITFVCTRREFEQRTREMWERTFLAAVQGQFSNSAGQRADAILVAMENADATVEVWSMRVIIRPSRFERFLDWCFGVPGETGSGLDDEDARA